MKICGIAIPAYLSTFLTNQPTNQPTNEPTNCRKQNPSWEANSCSASHEIPHILWKLKIHYHIHHSPPYVPILSQIIPVHALKSYFLKTHCNIIIPYSKCSPSFRFPHENHVHIYFHCHMCHMPNSSHPPWFDHSHLVRRKIHEATHYAILNSLLLLPPSWAKITK